MNFSADAARDGDSIFRKYQNVLIYCMRISLLICFVITVSLQVVAANWAKGQGMENVNVSIKLENEDLISAIKKIESSTPFRFLYRTSDVRNIDNLTYNAGTTSVQNLVKSLLAGSQLTFKQIDDRILITRATEKVAKVVPVAKFQIITGTVFDAKTKDRIPGATVALKNGQTKVLTDERGNFRINAAVDDVLLISYIGYETQEITVTKPVLEVRLQESAQSLKGVVVTGIFSQNKSTFTGAARTFNAQELSKVSNNNVLSALKSLDPSFQLPENLNMGSNPNVLPDVVLRGGNTLVDISQATVNNPFNYQPAPNSPLFILDGFETTLQRINDLDMNRIASVTILKDAGATAIYGSRGANGVIVIEMIRPVDGQLRVSYNANMSVEAPDLSGYDLLNAREKFELEDRSRTFYDNFNFRQDQMDYYRQSRLLAVQQGVNTDWISKPVRTGIGQKHNLYVEGGADAVSYGLNLTYDQKTGVMKSSDRNTTTANSFLSYRLKNFQFRNDLTLTFNKANNSPYGSFTQYTQLNPYWSPYNADGSFKVYLEDVTDPLNGGRLTNFDNFNNLNGYTGRPVNPLYNASLNLRDENKFTAITNNFETRWQAREWLRLTGRVAYTIQNDQSDIFLPAQHSSFAAKPTFEKGSYTRGTGRNQRLEGFLTGEANKTFDKHFLSASATLNVKENSYDTQRIRVEGFPNPNLDQLILGNQYPAGGKPTGTEGIVRSIGTLVRGAYAYDNRYLFDATYRLDGSSLFGSDRRYAPFWSLGAGWNIKNEAFFADVESMREFRLRYTVGTTGSESFESFKGVSTSQYFTDREYRGIIATYLLGFGNSALAWQKTLKNNIGVDLSFDRFSITANYFNERTKGSIAFISSAPSTGFGGYYDNMGDVVNKGYELYGRYNLIANPANRNNWSVFANLFHVTNKIEKISSTIQALNNRSNTVNSTTPLPRYAEGQSKNAIWAVKSLGIDPASGNEIFETLNGDKTTVYNPADQRIVGDATPDLQGTFGTNMEIKGFGFNVYIRFNIGGDAYNQTLIDRVENVNVRYYNVDRRVYNERWTQSGDIAFFKGILDNTGTPINTPRTFASSRFVQKNSFIAGESASIYYRFSDKLNNKIGLQNTKVTLFGSDIFRSSTIKRERGLDYPFSHSYTLQLQTSF